MIYFDVLLGDCSTLLPGRTAMADLIIADPPYNFGLEYADHDDNMKADEFLTWLQARVAACKEALSAAGTLCLFLPDELVADVDVYCRRTLNLNRRNWVVWIYTFGSAAKKRFTRSKTHVLIYTKSKTKFTFNADAVKVASARQAVYNDPRAVRGGKLPDDTWCLLKHQLEESVAEHADVMSESRVCGTFKSREVVSPTQIPVPLLMRLVASLSNPGELVLDPFSGTGSTGEAALRLGRNYLGMDISEVCVTASRKRLERIKQEG